MQHTQKHTPTCSTRINVIALGERKPLEAQPLCKKEKKIAPLNGSFDLFNIQKTYISASPLVLSFLGVVVVHQFVLGRYFCGGRSSVKVLC